MMREYHYNVQKEVQEGLEEDHERKQRIKYAGGIGRRIQYIEQNPQESADIEQWLLAQKLLRQEEAAEWGGELREEDYAKDGWQIHFEKYLDTLDMNALIDKTGEYRDLIASDPSAIQEYRICLSLLDRIYASGGCSMSKENEAMMITVRGQTLQFPLRFPWSQGREIQCRMNHLEAKSGQKKGEYFGEDLETVDRIIEGNDLERGYTLLLEAFGYDADKVGMQKEQLRSIIDPSVIAHVINEVDVNEYLQYGFQDTYFQNAFFPHQNMQRNLLASVLEYWTDGEPSERTRLNHVLGSMIGKLASRTTTLTLEEGTFLISSGLLENALIEQSLREKTKEASRQKWFDTEIDPIKDMKVKALYEYTRAVVDYASLEQQVAWSHFIESPDFCLDMTRGNDPAIFNEGCFLGIPEHKAKSAGYEPGIYCGVLGAFYDWSDRCRAMIKHVPLKYVDTIAGRGEAIVMGKQLHVRKIDESVTRYTSGEVYMGYAFVDASQAELEPYDDPEKVEFESVVGFDPHIPHRFLEVFQKYYPDARIEDKTIRVSNIKERFRFPFVILPPDARSNPIKVEFIKRATGVNNVVIE